MTCAAVASPSRQIQTEHRTGIAVTTERIVPIFSGCVQTVHATLLTVLAPGPAGGIPRPACVHGPRFENRFALQDSRSDYTE